MDTTFPFSPAVRRSVPAPVTPPLQRLAPHAVLPLRLPRGARIAVSAGRLWLTETGDLDDHFLGAGECHVVRRGGQVLLEGDSARLAEFEVTLPRRLGGP